MDIYTFVPFLAQALTIFHDKGRVLFLLPPLMGLTYSFTFA